MKMDNIQPNTLKCLFIYLFFSQSLARPFIYAAKVTFTNSIMLWYSIVAEDTVSTCQIYRSQYFAVEMLLR